MAKLLNFPKKTRVVSKNGTNDPPPSSQKFWSKKARKRYIARFTACQLYKENAHLRKSGDKIDLALLKGYSATYHFCNQVFVPNGDFDGLITKYCSRRHCPICASIIMARRIEKYKPYLDKLEDPYFVTLTAPTVVEDGLPNRLIELNGAWRKIYNAWNNVWCKKHPDLPRLNGIKKIECTVAKNNRYHAHFHIVVEGGRLVAERIINEWLKRMPEADRKAQDLRPITKDENGVLELFKYMTKPLIKEEGKDGKTSLKFPAKKLHVIYKAFYKRQLISPFGKLKTELKCISEELDEEELQAQPVPADSIKNWQWVGEYKAYLSEDGEMWGVSKRTQELCESLAGEGRSDFNGDEYGYFTNNEPPLDWGEVMMIGAELRKWSQTSLKEKPMEKTFPEVLSKRSYVLTIREVIKAKARDWGILDKVFLNGFLNYINEYADKHYTPCLADDFDKEVEDWCNTLYSEFDRRIEMYERYRGKSDKIINATKSIKRETQEEKRAKENSLPSLGFDPV